MAELHDNLGNDLTNIKMFSEVIPKYLINNVEKAGEYITFIKETAKNSMEQLRDFLGAIDTKYTTWDDMMNHFKERKRDVISPANSHWVIPKSEKYPNWGIDRINFNWYIGTQINADEHRFKY